MLLDTSGLLCYLHRDEPQHQEAVKLLNGATNKLLTHSYILAELIALALVRRFPRSAVLAFATDLLDNPDIETVWVGERIYTFAAVSHLILRCSERDNGLLPSKYQ
ncbi:PIN domain-containing protein [Synechococcus sp. PCC 7336]|uniref:PIN domain-containing protein n=1 Tax=Synechococcus sp. PCC 7336 TaxID=195250 RepID=UPI00034B506A|nr:PIN domain-containing protein [Synechococcus sp. PCC 7336]